GGGIPSARYWRAGAHRPRVVRRSSPGPVRCTAPWKHARRGLRDRRHPDRRACHLPRLRLRLRRHHGRGAARPTHRGAAGVRAGRRVVRGRPGPGRGADPWPCRDARARPGRGDGAPHRREAPARLSRGGHFLRSAARRRRDRRPAEGRNRQPGQHGRPRSARRAAPRTGRRDARRAAPARRARGVLGRRPGRALSALLRALRRRRRGAGGAGRENEPPGDRGGRGRSPRAGGRGWPRGDPAARRGRCARRDARERPGAYGGDRRAARAGDRPGPRDDHGTLRGPGRRCGAGRDARGPGPRRGPHRAGAGAERPDALCPFDAPGRRQPLGGGCGAHVADGIPVRGGLRTRVPDVPAARGRGRAAGGGRGGRGARDRRAGDVTRFRRAGARRRRHGRDRAPGECRGLETRRRGGHRRGGHPRGRYRVPHGRRAVAAAAGIGRGRRAQRGGHRTRPPGAAGGRRVTTPERLRLTSGTVYDPANGVDGVVRDVCIEAGRIVADLPAGAPRLDVRGMVVMPGGVDIHAHVAGSSVTHARRLLAEEHAADPVPAPRLADGPSPRAGSGGTVPSTFATGYRYAGLGYTTVMEAAVAPLAARQAHAELDDTPLIDSGFYVLLGNDDYLLRQLAARETARARDYAGWLLGVTRAYAIKIVNPGGGRAPFTHLQFHSYGGERGKPWKSRANDVIEYVNGHPEVSVDVGQVMFGPATTVTADGPVEHLLYASSGRKWVNVDIELETGCGIVPYSYREKAAVAALQWAVGLE